MIKLLKEKNYNNRGFTLIELLIVIVIIGTLAAVVAPRISSAADSARRSAMLSDINNMEVIIWSFATERRLGRAEAYDPSEIKDNWDAGDMTDKEWNEYARQMLDGFAGGGWPTKTPFGGYYTYRFYNEESGSVNWDNWERVSGDEGEKISDVVGEFPSPFEIIMIRFTDDEDNSEPAGGDDSEFKKVIEMLEDSKYYNRLYRYTGGQYNLGILIQ